MTENSDLLLDLNFVPAWARKKPSQGIQSEMYEQEREGRPRDRQNRGNRDRRGNRRAGPPRHGRTAPDGRRTDAASTLPAGEHKSDRLPVEPLPLKISFIPERHGLRPLIARLARTGLAYPLIELAAMFLSKPAYYAVKLEPAGAEDGHAPLELWQCSICSAVFTEQNKVTAHAMRAHLDEFYAIEQRACDPPKGIFKCVAKCGLSGEVICPPNYHAFNERVLELHAARYASMPIDDYRNRIVNDQDPELIEKWKQDASCQTIFRTLKAPEAKEFSRRAEADAYFLQNYAPKIVRTGKRFIISGVVTRKLEDKRLYSAIEGEWAREKRFPWRLATVLRPAFRHQNLYLFKAADAHWFVSSINPAPIEPGVQTTQIVRDILDCLLAHPGITRQDAAAALCPDAAPDSPQVAAVVHEIAWLRDRGHIIEFSDGRLAVPKAPTRSASKPARQKVDAQPDEETVKGEQP